MKHLPWPSQTLTLQGNLWKRCTEIFGTIRAQACFRCCETYLALLPVAASRQQALLEATTMSLGTILLIILILILIGALPTWPYSSGWGYYPSGGLGLILVIVLILVLLGRI
jgi:Protein of unknown function (DUF3309)